MSTVHRYTEDEIQSLRYERVERLSRTNRKEMYDGRFDFLVEKERAFLESNPELKIIRDKLLSIDGTFVILVYEDDNELALLLKKGRLISGKNAQMRKGRDGQCHSNAAQIWDSNPRRFKICTGYAMSDHDKVWRQHSWIWDNEQKRVIETTEKRELYYGYKLTRPESEEFWFMNW